jgi:hypothetical protein
VYLPPLIGDKTNVSVQKKLVSGSRDAQLICHWVRVSQIHPAIFSLTTCLSGHSVPLKSPASAYQSLSISSVFVIQTRAAYALPADVSITYRGRNLREPEDDS